MKRFILCLVSVLFISLSTLGVYAEEVNDIESTEENIKESTESSEEAELTEVSPEVLIESEIEDGVFKLHIENNSEADIKNTALIFDKSNRYSVMNEYADIGTIEAGSTKDIEKRLIDVGHGVIKKLCDMVGGVVFAVIVSYVVIMLLLVVLFMYRKFHLNLLPVWFTISIGVFLMLAFNKPVYESLDIGENYCYDLSEEYNDVTMGIKLRYNQDTIEQKVYTREDSIAFGTDYKYDDSKPVTDGKEILQEGIEGINLVTVTETYVNGEVVNTSEKSIVKKEPIDEIVVQGTKTVIQRENIEAKRVYSPDDSMYLGESRLATSLTEAEENVGLKEVTYTWNKETEKMESTEEVLKKEGTNIWKAGTKVEQVITIQPEMTYKALKDKEVGYSNVIKEGRAGSVTSLYTATIDEKTGKRVEGSDLKFISSETIEAEDGTIELGVLLVEEVEEDMEYSYTYDDTQWDNYRKVTEKGTQKVTKVTKIMKLDKDTGIVSNVRGDVVSTEVVKKGKKEKVIVGSKQPVWLEEKVMTEEVPFNTTYQEDTSGILQGDEQRIVQTGEVGSIYVTQLVACDENGNKIQGYEPRSVSSEIVVKPTEEIILVAEGSKLLLKN